MERDIGKAFERYLKAAGQGHAKAQYSVGMLYQSGVEGKMGNGWRRLRDRDMSWRHRIWRL